VAAAATFEKENEKEESKANEESKAKDEAKEMKKKTVKPPKGFVSPPLPTPPISRYCPLIVCVALDRTGGQFERNLRSVTHPDGDATKQPLVAGRDYYQFF
jgi:hypothetical protein